MGCHTNLCQECLLLQVPGVIRAKLVFGASRQRARAARQAESSPRVVRAGGRKQGARRAARGRLVGCLAVSTPLGQFRHFRFPASWARVRACRPGRHVGREWGHPVPEFGGAARPGSGGCPLGKSQKSQPLRARERELEFSKKAARLIGGFEPVSLTAQLQLEISIEFHAVYHCAIVQNLHRLHRWHRAREPLRNLKAR